MKTYKDILKTEKNLKGLCIENNILKSIDVNVIGHFGNISTLEMLFEDCCLFSHYNLSNVMGDVLKCIFECLELSEDNGKRLSDVKNVPVRIIYTSSFGNAVGFGHFMKDKFLLVEDVIAIAIENFQEKEGKQ